MTSQLLDKPAKQPIAEQRLTLPFMSWQQYESLREHLYNIPGVRTAYLDGEVEILTLSEEHENIKSQISRLLETYLNKVGIEFYRHSSFTMGGESVSASAEPDESYSLEEKKAAPHLIIEVIVTTGTLKRRKIFQRVGIQEAWFWKKGKLLLYRLQNDGDQRISRSELLPDLDINLFLQYVNHPDQKIAVREFRQLIRQNRQQ